jgi:hypothetical protein
MVPQAINSNTSQIDARVNYSMEKLRLSVAYYGSFFKNNNATLNPSVPGSLNNPLGTAPAAECRFAVDPEPAGGAGA